ncbi:LysM-like peptidoglycan-binding domain-containing protein, partial [Pseudomonas aeruginosa]|uniref:LysM-like peptidoglycan-binding domain-containing protein n=1 Tax=Pseudomonas aeruginosa TaxID=287 RepID=UPI000EF73D79
QDLPVPVAPSVSTDNQEQSQTTLPPAQDSLTANENNYSPTENESDNTIENDTTSPIVKQPQQPTTSADAWQTYTIKEGQTLAQLFRDNNLAVNDAFSMAKSEDKQKSLSQLRSGQTIRLQRNPQGEVSMLEVTNSTGTVITFTRLSDGSYYRTP